MKKEKIYIAVIAAVVVAVVCIIFATCSSDDDSEKVEQAKTEDVDVLMLMHRESKLYSAEVKARKVVSFSSKDYLNIFGHDFGVPFSRTEVKMPVDMTYRAYVDLSSITEHSIEYAADSSVTVILPDPVIELTSCEVDHNNEVHKKQLLAKTKSQEFMNEKVADAAEKASRQLELSKKTEMVESAKENANRIIAEIMLRAGYKKVNITYRKDFDINAMGITIDNENIKP